ncbi:MAG: MFS transporter, partial [Lentisphaeria bacterium]|nr:MFS transporter [Lentisphaeria bacterium]
MQGTDNTTPRSLALWTLLACGTGMYFFANMQRVAIPGAIFSQLQAEFQASASAVTGLGSSFMYIYAFNQLIIGMLIDRYGGIRVILYGGLVFCLGSLVFPLSHSLPMLYIGRVLTGFGASALYLSLIKEIMRCFDRNYPIMVSIMILFGYAGGIAANAPFVAVAAEIGYRSVLLVMAMLSLVLYFGFAGARLSLVLPAVKRDV